MMTRRVPQPIATPPAPAEDRTGLGIIMMIAVTVIFAVQDGLSRYLAGQYSPVFIIMLRYWFFAVFVTALVARQPGGLGRAVRSARPLLQVFRGVLLAAEVVVTVQAFVWLGLVETHAVFAVYPLLIAGLSGPVLGEKVGWRRWAAIGVGFVGILVILRPGHAVFSPAAALPLLAALMFALYGLLTRMASRCDPSMTSFFYTGVFGAIAMTVVGIWDWQWLRPGDWLWMGALCLTAMSSHYLMIRAYELAEASALQPFAYLQLVWASMIGVFVFSEALQPRVAIGAGIVVTAGVFILIRARKKAQAASSPAEDADR